LKTGLLTGAGRFVADLRFPDMLEAAFVRKEHGTAEVLVAFMDLVEEHLLTTSVPDYHWRISMQNSPKTLPPSVKHTLRREAGSKVTLDVEVDADRLKRAADAAFDIIIGTRKGDTRRSPLS